MKFALITATLIWLGFSQHLFAQDAPAASSPKPSVAPDPDKGWFVVLLENNPGIGTIVISSFLLPVVIMMLNNRQNRKMKEIESSLSLNIKKQEKDFSDESDFTKRQDSDQAEVYGYLVTILFDVQRLYIDLSVDCGNTQCVGDALKRFDEGLSKHHSEIAPKLAHLPSSVTGTVYGFYQRLGDLMIELRQIAASQSPELCYVATFEHSQELAGQVINLHKAISARYEALKKDFDAMHLESLRHCCGKEPDRGFRERYRHLKNELDNRSNPASSLPSLAPQSPNING